MRQELKNNKEQGYQLKKLGLKLKKFNNKNKGNRAVLEERDEFDSFDEYFKLYIVKFMKIKQLAQKDTNFQSYQPSYYFSSIELIKYFLFTSKTSQIP